MVIFKFFYQIRKRLHQSLNIVYGGKWNTRKDVLLNILFYISASDMEGKTEEEIEMIKVMGFGGFDSTKVRVNICQLEMHKIIFCANI